LVGPNRPTYQGDTQQKPKLLFFFFVIWPSQNQEREIAKSLNLPI
jgi:hypothetical protein